LIPEIFNVPGKAGRLRQPFFQAVNVSVTAREVMRMRHAVEWGAGISAMMLGLGCAQTAPFQDMRGTTAASPPVRLIAARQPAAEQAAQKAILKAYLSEITRYDGITLQEARIIAQSEIIFRGYGDIYYLQQPQVKFEDDRHFVFAFTPIVKTLEETVPRPERLVRVDKKSGAVHLPARKPF
jgi:hypothetical protein